MRRRNCSSLVLGRTLRPAVLAIAASMMASMALAWAPTSTVSAAAGAAGAGLGGPQGATVRGRQAAHRHGDQAGDDRDGKDDLAHEVHAHSLRAIGWL